MESVFDFGSYRDFLEKRLAKTGPSRGARSKLADFLGVKGAFISQVLGGSQNLSLEQAMLVSEFLQLHPEEEDYFILLVNFERAGSQKLRDHFEKKVRKIQAARREIKSRVKSNVSVTPEEQLAYFSSWINAALHALITIPAFREPRLMAKRLGVPLSVVERHLAFLERIGLAELKNGKYQAGKARIHIDRDNPHLARHHLNWRERTIVPLSVDLRDGQHYTCVLSASAADAEKIRQLWLKFLDGVEPIIAASPEEELYAIQWDFYKP